MTRQSPEKKEAIFGPNVNGKEISQIWSGKLLFHYPSRQMALREIVGFLEEVRETLF